MLLNNPIQQAFMRKLSSGLARKAVSNPAEWAQLYRTMTGSSYAGPWSFKYHPWTREMHVATEEFLCAQKAAQLGFSECALNHTFFNADIKANNVLYLLPTKKQVSEFSVSRFDPALDANPHLKALFSDVKNVSMKRAGAATVFFRGTRSRADLKSLPVSLLIVDEVDEMVMSMILLAFERLSGQIDRKILAFSTPSIDGKGINNFYRDSTQDHFFFKCPHCSRHDDLVFNDEDLSASNLVVCGDSVNDPDTKKSHLICKQCKHTLSHESKSDWLSLDNTIWVPQKPGASIRGFYVNQLYAMNIQPYKLAESYHTTKTSPAEEQIFWNDKMGVTRAVKGAKLTDEEVMKCRKAYRQKDNYTGSGLVTVGIDVGHENHYYHVVEWFETDTTVFDDANSTARGRVLDFGVVHTEDDLVSIVERFNASYAVIDAQPQVSLSENFCKRLRGIASMCYYTEGSNGRNITERGFQINVDRTAWLDVSLQRFRNGTIDLPSTADHVYASHMCAPTRVYKRNRTTGETIGRYETMDKVHDHYAHSLVYADVALAMACDLNVSRSGQV